MDGMLLELQSAIIQSHAQLSTLFGNARQFDSVCAMARAAFIQTAQLMAT